MPQPTAVMQVEGVLRKPVTGAPIESGRRLYLGLSQFYRIVLVTENDRQYSGEWLGMHSFTRHDHIVYFEDSIVTRKYFWLDTARSLRTRYGYDVDTCVVPDPADAALLIRYGFSTLLFTQAAYALPEWSPDHSKGIKPWEELTAEVQRGRAIRAADKRMEDDPLR